VHASASADPAGKSFRHFYNY